METEHGEVCMYVNGTISFSVLEDLQDPSFEMLWIKIMPACLPRGCTPSIVVVALYHQPSTSDPALIDNLSKCLLSIESPLSNCGIFVVGDFNRLDITSLQNNFNLKEIVHFPTRGSRTLDLMRVVQYSDIMRFMALHNRHHKVSPNLNP